MKIHNNLPVQGKATRKSSSSHTSGVFGALLESEIEQVQSVGEATAEPDQRSAQSAWQALEESVSLLDRAMQCMEDGGSPSPQLISDIEQLRCCLQQQVNAGGGNSELRQADTLLAVEAERIRAMRS